MVASIEVDLPETEAQNLSTAEEPLTITITGDGVIFIHLVVAHNTDDKSPVWIQEAIAKYLDNRWRDGEDRWRLSVLDQGLLVEVSDGAALVRGRLR